MYWKWKCKTHTRRIKKKQATKIKCKSILTRSYRFLSFSAIASYLDLTVGSTSDHFFPNSLAMSPTPYSGFTALTFERSSLQNQKKADLNESKSNVKKINHCGTILWLFKCWNSEKIINQHRCWHHAYWNTYSDRFGAFGSLICFRFLPRPKTTPFGGT